jgi:hypothetical protein
MLKYMIHEVRELKRSIDPNAPDIHVRRPGSMDDVSSEERLEEHSEEVVTHGDDGEVTVERTYSKSCSFKTRGVGGDGSTSPRPRRLLPTTPDDMNKPYPQSAFTVIRPTHVDSPSQSMKAVMYNPRAPSAFAPQQHRGSSPADRRRELIDELREYVML